MSADTALPTQKLFLRVPDATSILLANPGEKPTLQPGKLNSVQTSQPPTWSSDGALLAIVSPAAVTIFDAESEKQVGSLPLQGVIAASFSPLGNLLLTFQKAAADKGNADKNLKLWDWRKREVVLQLFQKHFTRDAWPSLLVQHNETQAFHQVGGAVNIYDLKDLSAGVKAKLAVKGLGGFAVSPSHDRPLIAAYIPEAKGSPGFVGVWDLAGLTKSPESPAPLARRSFFRASYVRLMWNSKATAVLALTASDTDATNQSYYGEQKLHFLSADGSNDCIVPLPKEGPIHDVQWSPQGDFFLVAAGFMPAKVTLFTQKCDPFYDLGSGPYNMVRWSPQGRFIAVAGFGNLPGDVAFFDRKADNKCKPMGNVRVENGVTAEWSPDGRRLLVATTAPRLRVDNKVTLLRYTGEVVETKPVEVLLEASWRPAPEGTFPDLPQSPRAAGAAAKAAAAAPKAGYVAPHLRGSGGGSAGGNFSLARDADSAGPGRLGGPPVRFLPPGAAPPESKTASKNARRRRKKTGGKGDADGDEGGQGDDDEGGGEGPVQATAAGVGAINLSGDRSSTGNVASTGNGNAAPGGGAGDREKKVRNLEKKLRQIEQLKEKRDSGAKLEPEQLSKIAGEAALRTEIKALEAGE